MPDRLGDGDLDVVDELAVPDRLEDAVREPQRQHVLDRLLAEVVVDPEDLVLGEVLAGASAFSSRAEARSWPNGFSMISRVQPSAGPALADLAARASRSRPAGPRSSRRGCRRCRAPRRPREQRRRAASSPVSSAKSSVDVAHPGRRARPRRPGGTGRARAPGPPRCIRSRNSSSVSVGARGADDRELLRQQPPERERVERRHQLALRQVAGGAEDDEHARLGRAAAAGGPRAAGCPAPSASRRPSFAAFTAWPPNWLRSAAFTFAANDSSCRDAKRAKSAAVITGTGTSSAIASAIVQRPSPESST